jgi:putative serine protease PepD
VHRSTFLAALIGGLVAALAVAALFLGTGLGDDDPEPDRVRRSVPAVEGAPTVSQVYARAGRAIVRVDARERGTPLPAGRPRLSDDVATGTGFVVTRTGTIVTNAHVVAGGPVVTVRFRRRGKRYRARVIGRERSSDLALLKIRARRLPTLGLGASRPVRVGDRAIALGNPLGLERTLTLGVVSAVNRRIRAPDGATIDRVLQTDAAINPGSSGGPLLDERGRVIGVTTQSGGPSIGYAVPVDRVKRALERQRR